MTRIPLPGQGGEALQRGVEQGGNMFANLLGQGRQQGQFAQQMALKQQLLPYQIQQYENQALMAPAQRQYYEALTAKANLEANPKAKYDALQSIFENGQMPDFNTMDPMQRALVEAVVGRPLNASLTPAQKEAQQIFGNLSDPGAMQYVADKSKLFFQSPEATESDFEQRQMPEFAAVNEQLQNAIPMNMYNPGERSAARKRMNEELQNIQTGKQVKHAISQAQSIMRENPDLYRKAVGIIVNPEQDPGKIDSALRAILPQKDQLEPFLKLDKLYSEILTKQAQKNNMTRSVYGMRLQARAKAQTKNPNEVNEMIFSNILHEIEPQIGREPALLYALKHNMDLPYTLDYGKKIAAKQQPENVLPNPNEIQSPTQLGMKKGFINGQEVDVRPEDEEDFIRAGGRI